MKKIIILLLTLICTLASAQSRTADSITIVHTKWDIVKQHGVKTHHARFSNLYGGPQDIYMVEIPLRRHTLHVQDHAGRMLTSEASRQFGAKVAINGTYFQMTPNGRSLCLAVRDGHVLDFTANPIGQLSNGAIVMHNHQARIIPWDVEQERALFPDSLATAPYTHADIMVCGPLMLQEGREMQFHEQDHVLAKHPRSGIALRGRKAFFIVVDGRAPERAAGVTIAEFAHFLRILGMESALNLDGGGSSTLWTPASGIFNTPSSQGIERAVSNAIIAR